MQLDGGVSMSDIKESTNLLLTKINDLLIEYQGLDDIAPFTPEIFAEIKVLLNSLYDKEVATLDEMVKQINSLKLRKDNLLNDYENGQINLDEDLKDGLNKIKRSYEEKINNLNSQINESKLANERMKEETIQDIEYYKMSSIQHIEMFESEYNDSISRFNYQYSIAKESYDNNIIYYNNSLAKEITKLDTTHETSLSDYDEETTAMRLLYTEKIQQQTEALEGINKEYKESLSNYKVKKSSETESLNNKIRGLAELKNQKIEDIKKNYAELNNTLNEKREQDNQDNNIKNQNIIKEFVYNMDEAEAHLNSEKRKFTAEMDNEYELYFENQFRLHKAQEKEIKRLKNEPFDEKSLRVAFKRINKEYDDIENENAKTHKLIIDRLNKELMLIMENNSYQKKRMDINRTSSIKSLNLEEIKNNKRFQEENNRHEDEMGFEVSLSNSRYNIDANNVRLDSNIRLLNLQREIQALDAKHQKDVRRINNTIRMNKLEIDFANQTNKLIHDYEEIKYNKRINYLTVTNLLEIEKCKVLNAYNRKQYELNILNSKLLLNYSKDKFHLQDEKYEATKKHELKVADKRLENLINSTAYRIKELSFKEEQEYALLKQNKIYSLDLLSHNVLVNRFKLNIKSLNISLASFIILIKGLEEHTAKIINAIISKVSPIDNDLKLVRGFIYKLTMEILGYHINLIKLFDDVAGGIINNHLSFEEDFKFKTVLEQLKEKYDSDCVYIKGEKDRLQNEINEAVYKIDNITSRISRLELTNSFTYDRHKNRSKKTIKKNKRTIKKLFKLIRKNEHDNERNYKKIRILDIRLERTNLNYQQDINTIKRLQYNSSQAYHILKDSLGEVTSSMIQRLYAQGQSINNERANLEDLNSSIVKSKQEFLDFNNNEIKRLYTLLYNFNHSNNHNLNASFEKIKSENLSSIRKIKETTNNKILVTKDIFSRTDQNQKQEIEALKHEGYLIEREFVRKEHLASKNFQVSVNNILESRQDNQATFFTELYAICDNKNDIELSYKEDMIVEGKSFDNKKAQILERTIQAKHDFNEKLDRYIRARNLIIRNLPSDTKEKRLVIANENKDKNNEIELEISNLKATLYQNRKDSKKTLNQIDQTFLENTKEVELERNKLLSKEKHKYQAAVHKLR